MASSVMYFIRRFLLVKMIFIRESLQGIQVHLMMMFNLASLMYAAGFRPFIGKNQNRL